MELLPTVLNVPQPPNASVLPTSPVTMASRGVSVLKFIGTVSLGLLTGLSYSLSTVTLPALLTLPSADAAAHAFQRLSEPATTQLRSLAAASSTAFALAFALSSRPYRHPYLLYASLLALGSGAVTLDAVAPYLQYLQSCVTRATPPPQKKDKKADGRAARLEASYVELGTDGAHSEGASSAGEGEDDTGPYNGEEVRAEVDGFMKKQWIQTAVAGVGFVMAVIGIWGDGAVQVFQSETFVIEV